MSLIAHIRIRTPRLAAISASLFVLTWLSLVASPCALAMLAPDTGRDCPHCPPAPCHEVQPDDCDYPESLDAPRAGENQAFEIAAVLPAVPESVSVRPTPAAPKFSLAPARAGPRLHLRLVRFDE